MRFECDQLSLVNTINTVMPALTSGSLMPVLSSILIEALEGYVYLVGYNTEIGIKAVMPAMVEEAGNCLVDGKMFLSVIKKCGKGTIFLEAADNKVTLKWKKSEFEFESLDVAQYPQIPWGTEDSQVKMDMGLLTSGLSSVVFAAAKTGERPTLNAVCMVASADDMDMVAIDGVRLARKKMQGIGIEGKWIIPLNAVKAITKLGKSGEAILNFMPNSIVLEHNDVKMMIRLIEGQYPPYEQIIPAPTKMRLTVPRQEIVDALDRVGTVAVDNPDHTVRLHWVDDELRLSARSDGNKASESVAAEKEGEEISISLNHMLLSECISAAGSTEVTVSADGAFTPCLIQSDDPDWVSVIMPLREAVNP